jgi:hypothetical protein
VTTEFVVAPLLASLLAPLLVPLLAPLLPTDGVAVFVLPSGVVLLPQALNSIDELDNVIQTSNLPIVEFVDVLIFIGFVFLKICPGAAPEQYGSMMPRNGMLLPLDGR